MPPLSLMIKPASSACNMACRYCFYADVANNRSQKSMGIMSYETLENTVRRAFAYADGSVSIAFQGGEPTLAGAAFFQKLVELEKKYNARGIRVMNSVQTNGYEISDELIALFARERFLVGVSYDGTAETHDRMRVDRAGQATSQRIEQTIRRLGEAGVAFNILCVVNEYVAAQAERVFRNLERYKFIQYIPCISPFDGSMPEFSLKAESYTEFLKKSFDLYYESFRKGSRVSIRNFDNYLSILLGMPPENCGMSGRCAQYYLIEADGGVYPCDFYVLDEWKMGNINDSAFFKLAKSPVAAKFREDSLHISQECRQCEWYGLCRGGCRRDREPFENGLPVLNKWCECYKALFAYAYPRMREMAETLARENRAKAL